MKTILRKQFNKLTIERYPGIFRPSSNPFISGDTFRNIANHIFDEAQSFDPSEVNKNDIVFVNSELIEVYFKVQHKFIKNQYILITHNSDRNVDEKVLNFLDEKIIHWFSQNLIAKSNNSVSIIPIGLENRRWLKFGKKKWFRKIKKNNKEKNILLSFNIYNNFKERNETFQILKDLEIVNCLKFNSPGEYFKNLSKYKFVICPEGNGSDTHRLWESLIFNTIPIVKNSDFTYNLQSLNVPCLYVDDWNEVGKLSDKNLQNIYTELSSKNKDFIYLDYWRKVFINKKI